MQIITVRLKNFDCMRKSEVSTIYIRGTEGLQIVLEEKKVESFIVVFYLSV